MRRFGFVVVEAPGNLLDWGVRRSYLKTQDHARVLVAGRLRPLLKVWNPDMVIIRIRSQGEKRLRSIVRELNKEVAEGASLLVKSDSSTLGSKYDRALAIAARFPELDWKVPAKRKAWESEHYSMSIFEALELAMSTHQPG